MTDAAIPLGFEPEDLDGHTLDELTEYLERDRQPADPSIDDSPACRNALRALEGVRRLARAYLDEVPPPGEQRWIESVLAAIPIDARAGRRFPFPVGDPAVTVHITEGAIRGFVRAVGDDVPGLLVGSVRLGSDEPVPLSIDVAVVYGVQVTGAVESFRQALRQALPEQVPFPIGSIDVHVVGVIDPPGSDGSGR